MKPIILILLFMVFDNLCQAKKLSGRWQTQTAEISDTYLGNYLFNDSIFNYTINGYDGLNPIQVLGGTYFIKSDTIFFTVKYIKNMIGGKLERSEIYTQNDSWAFEGGTIETVNLTPPVHTVATFKLQNDILLIDERKFCKLNVKDDSDE